MIEGQDNIGHWIRSRPGQRKYYYGTAEGRIRVLRRIRLEEDALCQREEGKIAKEALSAGETVDENTVIKLHEA